MLRERAVGFDGLPGAVATLYVRESCAETSVARVGGIKEKEEELGSVEEDEYGNCVVRRRCSVVRGLV